jgi:UDP-N-acetylmuramate dehydrogenase
MPAYPNFSLLPFNTFGLNVHAERYISIGSVAELQGVLSNERPVLILGGGSNIVFTRDVEGLVVKNDIVGKKIVQETETDVRVRVGAGENWHNFVVWAVEQNLGGIENLSLIPGSVGASPIQNIGAYGTEVKDVLLAVEAVDLDNGQLANFSNSDCQFGYRDSIFKRGAKGRYCITTVTFALTKPGFHKVSVSYGDIRKTLDTNGIGDDPSISDISRAVISIRSSKLPDPAKIGNCGSFFKNPEVEKSVLNNILPVYPNAPHYELPMDRVKIPAGWLIEQCGWKGKRVGNTGCYEKQALVLVNHGNATGAEVLQLATDIIASVEAKFAIRLEPEVNIW